MAHAKLNFVGMAILVVTFSDNRVIKL
jgi:hypothetical protein